MGSNRNYEEEIEEMALIVQSNPEQLKLLLSNYDELIKKSILFGKATKHERTSVLE